MKSMKKHEEECIHIKKKYLKIILSLVVLIVQIIGLYYLCGLEYGSGSFEIVGQVGCVLSLIVTVIINILLLGDIEKRLHSGYWYGKRVQHIQRCYRK